MVLAESAAAPLVLVFEDLHWGDLPSVTFVDSALRAAAERPLLVFAAARAEIHDAFPRLWEQRSPQEIRLGPLVRRAGERLVREILGDAVGPEEMGRLLDRAAGNVFYLEELIRAHAEGASDRPRPSTYPRDPRETGSGSPTPSTDGGESSRLPGTVLAMVQARLERLDPMARRVLRAASVFGNVFWRGAVLALTGGEYKASEIDEWLSELVRAEIVQRRETSRFLHEREYVFRHAIVREVAYEMLTAEDVALGHKLAAGWLERAGEHEAMLLGEHFERGGDLPKAAGFYAHAAAEALEGNDFAAARQRAERAIAAAPAGADRGRLHLLLAEAARWAVDHERAVVDARAALEALPEGSDDWYAAAAEAIDAAVPLGHVDDVRRYAELMQARAGEGGPMTTARVIAICRIVTRLVFAGLGMYDVASALLTHIEPDARKLADAEPSARAFLLAAQGAVAVIRGDIEEAAKHARASSECFALVGDLRNTAIQRHRAGYAFAQLGLFDQAEEILRDAIIAAEQLGLAGVANDARLQLGYVFLRAERREEALSTTRDALEGYVAARDRSGEGRARGYLAGAYQILKEHEAATAEIQKAMPLLDELPGFRATLLGVMALAFADQGDGERAFAAGSEAMKLLEQLGGAFEGAAVVQVAFAEALNAKGDVEGAKRAVAVARERLLERASRIKNLEWRKNFLGTIQEHVRILARAGEWLV